jgi:KUP system potassium uptake protein
MSTWKRGADRIRAHSAERGPSLEEFIDEIGVGAVERVPGTAVYLTGTPAGTPTALLHQVQHNRVVHERVIVLSVRTVRVPHVSSEHRIRVKQLEEGFIGVTVRYGFMETVDIAEALKALEDEIPSVAQASIFVSRGVVIPTEGISLSRWRARLFGFIARNAPRMSMVVNLPHERVIELGVEVEL